jgi:hypothetical protein
VDRVRESDQLVRHLFGKAWFKKPDAEVESFNSLAKNANDELGNTSSQELDDGAEGALVIGSVDKLVALFREALADRDDLDV